MQTSAFKQIIENVDLVILVLAFIHSMPQANILFTPTVDWDPAGQGLLQEDCTRV